MHASNTDVGTKDSVRIGASETTTGEAVGTGGGLAETGEAVAEVAETVGTAAETGATGLGVAATGASSDEFPLLCSVSCLQPKSLGGSIDSLQTVASIQSAAVDTRA